MKSISIMKSIILSFSLLLINLPSYAAGQLVFGPTARTQFEDFKTRLGDSFQDFENIPVSNITTTALIPGVTFRTTRDRAFQHDNAISTGVNVICSPAQPFSGSCANPNHHISGVRAGNTTDGQSVYEIEFTTPQLRAGLLRNWNTDTRTFFYSGATLLASHQNTVGLEFVGFIADTDLITKIVIDGANTPANGFPRGIYQSGYSDDLFYGTTPDTPTTFTVGGNVAGLAAGNTAILQNNGGDNTTLGNGNFTFDTAINDGSAYVVTVLTQPTSPNQTCVVTNGSDDIDGANVTNVSVVCTTNTYTVGGDVTGLASGNSVTLQNNSGDDLTIGNGSFSFATALDDESVYAATVLTQPTTPSQTCLVSNGAANLAGQNVINISIDCTTNTYSVGGVVSGLEIPVDIEIQLNGGDIITLNSNGFFNFPNLLDDESTYDITIISSAGYACSITNGSGILAGGDINNVNISCEFFTPIPTLQEWSLILLSALLLLVSLSFSRKRQIR